MVPSSLLAVGIKWEKEHEVPGLGMLHRGRSPVMSPCPVGSLPSHGVAFLPPVSPTVPATLTSPLSPPTSPGCERRHLVPIDQHFSQAPHVPSWLQLPPPTLSHHPYIIATQGWACEVLALRVVQMYGVEKERLLAFRVSLASLSSWPVTTQPMCQISVRQEGF